MTALDLETLSYKDIGGRLINNLRNRNQSDVPSLLLQNLEQLSAQAQSPATTTFLWLCASQYLRSNFQKRKSYDKIFQNFWNDNGRRIKEFLATAPVNFLGENSKHLTESIFHTDIINQILSTRLVDLTESHTPEMVADLLRLYRGMRLMPPYELINEIPHKPILSRDDLRDYVLLLHGISRAGLSVSHLDLMEPIKTTSWKMMRGLGEHDKNSLLWSLTAQFAFAHDGETPFDPMLLNAYNALRDKMRRYIRNDQHLLQTFNIASIALGFNPAQAKYDRHDRTSKAEYKFMHDFREYGLTPDERADLKRTDIAKHVMHLDREVDGHYMIGGQPVIIEFDGRSHYRESANGYGDEPNGSTKLQTHVLQKLFPEHVIIRLHYQLGNSFTSLPADQKAGTFVQLRELIETLRPNAYYMDLHNGELRMQTARELQLRHNNENGITRQPTQM